jgi:hypothetical protein
MKLVPILFLTSLFSCQEAKPKKVVCSQKKELELYINNDSWTDSLNRAQLVLDDSTIVDAQILRRRTGSEVLYKAFSICPGKHQLNVRFGQFKKDTLIAINGDQSLFVSLSYATYEGADNGIAIAILEHDYNWYHRVD